MRFAFGYALGARKAIISAPHWHAAELVDDGCAALVPFEDPAAVADTVELLDNASARQAMRKRAYLYAGHMVWNPGSAVLHSEPSYASALIATCPRGVSPPSCREERYPPFHKCLTAFPTRIGKRIGAYTSYASVDFEANRMSRGGRTL